MARLYLAAVLFVVLVLGTDARPYYYGYHMPWYPMSPCNPYPMPCSPYPYPCGAPQPPRPTPCNPNPQPRPPPIEPPSTYDQKTAEEALLTQDINQRPVRHGIMSPYAVQPRPRRVRPLRKFHRYPELISNPQDQFYNPAHEYRALKRKPYRRGRYRGGRVMHDEGEYDPQEEEDEEYDEGDYGDDGLARDDPIDQMEDQDDYENDEEDDY